MTTFTFEAQGSIHNGGAKYYQVIRIASELSGRAAVVTHWGKVRPGAPSEPKCHGQHKTDLISGSGIPAFNSAIANKRKRGYSGWKTTASGTSLTEEELVTRVNRWFDPSDTGAILAHLCPVKDDEEASESADDGYIYEVFDSTPANASADREEWGTW